MCIDRKMIYCNRNTWMSFQNSTRSSLMCSQNRRRRARKWFLYLSWIRANSISHRMLTKSEEKYIVSRHLKIHSYTFIFCEITNVFWLIPLFWLSCFVWSFTWKLRTIAIWRGSGCTSDLFENFIHYIWWSISECQLMMQPFFTYHIAICCKTNEKWFLFMMILLNLQHFYISP